MHTKGHTPKHVCPRGLGRLQDPARVVDLVHHIPKVCIGDHPLGHVLLDSHQRRNGRWEGYHRDEKGALWRDVRVLIRQLHSDRVRACPCVATNAARELVVASFG